MFKGASNAPGGITIDLKLLNEISVLEDKNGEAEVTRVGPGNRWKDVYQKLDPMGLTVVGGRASIVGVGGFILGGEFCPKPEISELYEDDSFRGNKSCLSPSWMGIRQRPQLRSETSDIPSCFYLLTSASRWS